MPHSKAVDIIAQGRGSHFDPDMVDAFLSIQDQFQAIAGTYSDSEEDLQVKADYADVAGLPYR
jgi:putative two-component system response regulator